MKKYRIFLVLGSRATPGDSSRIWIKNLYEPLVALGHDVELLDIDDYAKERGFGFMSAEARESLSNELPSIFGKAHEKKPFDIFLSYLQNVQIFPDVLREIKKQIYTINYTTNFHQFGIYKEIASIVDYNIYITKVAKEGFDSVGAKSYWMPLAANPQFYKPSQLKNNQCVFIGSNYGPRAYLFWRLLQLGVDLQIYGHGWNVQKNTELTKTFRSRIKNLVQQYTGFTIHRTSEEKSIEDKVRCHYQELNDAILSALRRNYSKNLHEGLNDNLYAKTLAEAGAVINIQEGRYNHDYFNPHVLYGSNLRDYEATMSGTFLLTQYSDEITELFEVDKEVICYHNEHDLAEKINFYNSHPALKEQITKAGYEKSVSCHTWEKRFTDFFNHLNL